MAEGIMNAKIVNSFGNRLEVSSAGTFAWEGHPASALAVEVLDEVGVDITGHRARHLSRDMIETADAIVAMAREHMAEVIRLVPAAKSKVIVLGDLDRSRRSADIDDPIGGDKELYTRVRDEISGLIDNLITYLIDKFKLKY